KKISIEDLKRGSFKHNLEFLQWFKKFFDIHRTAQANLLALAGCKISAEPIQKLSTLETEPKPITHQPSSEAEEKPTTSQATSDSSEKISQLTPSIKGKTPNKAKPVLVKSMAKNLRAHDNSKLKDSVAGKRPKAASKNNENSISPMGLQVLTERVHLLSEQLTCLEHEKNFYFDKLKKIEILLQETTEKQEYLEFCDCAFKVLHTTEGYRSTTAAIESSKD
uniref:EB1 C-terminal domain-containing protein n=1 Tax=Glossina brevipalpis TaxID=37001 RepID=A0A1A9WPA8_9MUSC